MNLVIHCRWCDGLFLQKQKHQVYCSAKCRINWGNKTNGYSRSILDIKLCPGTVGAISELMVSIDLMKKGFEVYRALSPSSSCDLLTVKDKKYYSFEVRTGRKSRINNNISYSKYHIKAKNIAIYIYEVNEVHYFPSLDSLKN